MRLKVRTSAGVQVVTVADLQTIAGFFDELAALRGLAVSQTVGVKSGFPPKSVDIGDRTKTLAEVGIRNGDQLVVESMDTSSECAEAGSAQEIPDSASWKQRAAQTSEIPSVYVPELDKYLILRNVADDNSCMFNAIIYAVRGAFGVQELREMCAGAIQEDPVKYDEVTLGRTNEAYARWIQKKDSWGGAIELGILSEFLDLTINCIDIELGSVIKFQTSNAQTPNFIYLVYLGIHYDVLSTNSVLSTQQPDKNNDESVWSEEEAGSKYIHTAATQLCKLLQTKNYTTNTTTFRVRCLECYEVLVGETGAAKHANSTGHYKFGEVTK